MPKTVTRQRRVFDLNPGTSAPESSTLTTRLPSPIRVANRPTRKQGKLVACMRSRGYGHIEADAVDRNRTTASTSRSVQASQHRGCCRRICTPTLAVTQLSAAYCYRCAGFIHIFIRINCSYKNKKFKKTKEKETHNVSKNTTCQMHANYAQRKRKIT